MDKENKIVNHDKLSIKREAVNVIITVITAVIHAFGLWTFVYPAKFAPSEMAGVFTILDDITGLNAGYYSLMFNIPLLIVAWFVLKKRYVIYAVLFTVLSSVMLIVCEAVSFYQYKDTTNGLLAAAFSGVLFGFRTGLMLKIGSSTGGSDILAGFVQVKKPYLNVEKGIAVIGYAIAILSVLWYRDLTCVLLSIVQLFIIERVAGSVLKDRRGAIEVKIVTNNPEELRDEILLKLRHGATIIESKGMYTDKASYVVLCVLNTHQLPDVTKIIKKYPNTFIYYSEVMGVNGNFRWRKDEEVK